MNYQLCKEFPAFTPFAIECEKYHKVITLYSNVRKIQIAESERKEQAESNVIRKKAGNNWF